MLEIPTLVVLLLAGAPVNIYACVQLWRPKKPTVVAGVKRSAKFSANFLLLQRLLNVSDILIIYVYLLRELLELLLDRHWLAGSFVCKFCHMAETFGLSLSSNTLVCIAVDRLISISSLKANVRETNLVSGRVIFSAILACLASLIISFPQIFLWNSVEFLSGNETVTSCTTTWQFYDVDNSSIIPQWIELYASFQSIFISPVQTLSIAILYVFIGIFVHRAVPLASSAVHESVELLSSTGSGHGTGRSFISFIRRWQANFKKSISVFKAANVLVVIYAACWLPYNIAVIWSFVDPISYTEHGANWKFLIYFIALTAVLNPIVYKMCGTV